MSKRTKNGRVKNPPAVEVTKDEMLNSPTICQFCHLGETKDILQSGRLYKLYTGTKNIEYYHYFCILFSREGIQRGKDEEGLNGFLLDDIKKEVKRGASIKCYICKQFGATIPCHGKKCTKNYHFSCGATSNPEHLYVFRNNMDSFCWTHAPRQKKTSHVVADAACMVCLDNSSAAGPGPGRLVSPCCGRTFHRDCVQKTALQAGKLSLKCPACNSNDKFNVEMERCGIYIPHADATWEMPENSNFYQFEDMLHLYKSCDVETCLNPKGRDHSKSGSLYELIKCQTCGQSGVHVACGKLDLKKPIYICSACQPSTEDDSDDDEDIHESVLRHEAKRAALISKRNRLIEEEQKRLSATKKKQDDMIQRIKSIFASDSDTEKQPDETYCGSHRSGVPVKIVTNEGRETADVNSVYNKFYGIKRTAIGLPRKENTMPNINHANGESITIEDSELDSPIKICDVFSGNEVDSSLPQYSNCFASPPSCEQSSRSSSNASSAGISDPNADDKSDCAEDLVDDAFVDQC